MTLKDYTTRVLVADEGHVLTQAGDVNPLGRSLSPRIYLAATDDPANWREITDEEAEAYRAEAEAAFAAIENDNPSCSRPN